MRSRKIAAACAALGLVVAACGSDDDSSDSAADATDLKGIQAYMQDSYVHETIIEAHSPHRKKNFVSPC